MKVEILTHSVPAILFREMEIQYRELTKLREENERLKHDGKLRRCDIPACNCNGFHSDYASRMSEYAEKYEQAREEIAKLRKVVDVLRAYRDGKPAILLADVYEPLRELDEEKP
jgi:hypothetical protein